MSKLSFTVRTLKSIATSRGPPLTKEANKPLVLQVAAGSGIVHVVLEFAQPVKIKNLIFKNAGAASETQTMRYDAVQCSAHPTDGARGWLLADPTHSFVALRVLSLGLCFQFFDCVRRHER